MAMGDEDYSGDYTDSGESEYGDDLSRYSQEAQDYIRANSQTRINGVPVGDDGKNTAGFGKFGKKKDEDGNSKWGLLRKGEQEASKKPNVGGKGGDKNASLGEKENNVGSDNDQSTAGKFKNAVQGVKDLKSGKIGKGKGKLKKAGPLMAVLALCLGFGGASFFGQMSMPFSLMSVLQGNFDSIGVSNMSRNNKMLAWQLKPNTRTVSDNANEFVKKHSKIYQKFTGKSEKYFSISAKQKRKFKKAGIEIKTDADTGEKVMEFKRANGEVMTVTAENFKSTVETDNEFGAAFEQGTKTWRKAVSDWFDKVAKAFLKKIDVVRNRFKDYRKTDDQAKNKEEFENKVREATGDGDMNGKTGDAEIGEKTETNQQTGEQSTKPNLEGDGGEAQLTLKKGMSASDVEAKLKGFSEGVGGKITKVATKLAQGGCMAAEIVGAINMLVIASEAVQILQVASTVFEGIQKSQVEDSTTAPVNEIGNSLTRNKKTTYETAKGEKKEKNGSAMSAAAISALYGNTATDPNDPSVNSFNLTDSINSVMKAVGSTMAAYKTCTFAKIGAGLAEAVMDGVDVATDVAAVAACIGGAAETFGISCLPLLGKKLIKIGAGIAAGFALSEIIGHVISFFVPKIVTMLARDLATDIGGEDFGNAIASGVNMYMGQNHQYGGGSVASKETLITYLNHQQEYIAEQARYDRQTKSPFDATSQYTFLGTLLAKSIPLLTQTSSITSGITNLGNFAMNSVASIIPHASAMQSGITAQAAAENTAKRFPELDSIGAVGDVFGNPYFVTDFGTMDVDPAEVTYKVSELGNKNNFDLSNEDEDVPTINEDVKESRLMQYIVYCGQRSGTTFGMADQNIANDINSGAGSLEASIPVWGGIADMFQGADIVDHIGYVSGEACVTKNESTGLGSDVFKWDEAKYYQRFIEDQRLAENMGLVEESSVSVALRHYYEKNPIDDSADGIIAYYSGMSKEKVADTFDMLEGIMWIAGYDPSEMYPIHQVEMEVAENNKKVIEQEQVSVNELFVTPKTTYFVYRKEYTRG